MESVEVDKEAGVKIGDEIGLDILEIVVGDGGDLCLRQDWYYVATREYRVIECRHFFFVLLRIRVIVCRESEGKNIKLEVEI